MAKTKVTPEFKQDSRNANRGTDRGRAMVEASLREVGAGRSIVSDRDGRIIAGNKTLAAAEKMGLKLRVIETDGRELVVVQRNDLDLTDDTGPARKMAWLDNRASEVGLAWDAEVLLADLNNGLSFDGLFDKAELDALLAGLVKVDPVQDPGPQIDKADELRVKWGVELGQLWQLGAHRLICGDCTDKATVARLMGGEKADMVFTDPPYGYEYESNYYKDGNPFGKLKNDDSILDFVSPTLEFMKDDSAIYVCAGHQTLPEWRIMLDSKLTYKNTIIWKKNNWSMGDLEGAYAGQYEAILFYHHGRVKLLDGRPRDVWEFDRTPPTDHPTQKPVELVSFAITNTALCGSVVADWFSGSGTTLIACEQLSRQCRAVEISPAYVAVAIQRWADATGQTPVLNGE